MPGTGFSSAKRGVGVAADRLIRGGEGTCACLAFGAHLSLQSFEQPVAWSICPVLLCNRGCTLLQSRKKNLFAGVWAIGQNNNKEDRMRLVHHQK